VPLYEFSHRDGGFDIEIIVGRVEARKQALEFKASFISRFDSSNHFRMSHSLENFLYLGKLQLTILVGVKMFKRLEYKQLAVRCQFSVELAQEDFVVELALSLKVKNAKQHFQVA
jgi:hypothetical protein